MTLHIKSTYTYNIYVLYIVYIFDEYTLIYLELQFFLKSYSLFIFLCIFF